MVEIASFEGTIGLDVVDGGLREAEVERVVAVLDGGLDSLVWHGLHELLVLLHEFLTARQHSLTPDAWPLLHSRLVF